MYIHFDEIDSTNTYLKTYYNDHPDKTFVSCNHQTKGRGRLGRSYQERKNENLLISFLLKKDKYFYNNITLKTASIVYLFLKNRFNLNDKLTCKWPNDIFYENKKLVGILTESVVEDGKIKAIIIGIGINICQDSFNNDLNDSAISLKMITGINYDLNTLRDEFTMYFLEKIDDEYDYIKVINNALFKKNEEIEYYPIATVDNDQKDDNTIIKTKAIIVDVDDNGLLNLSIDGQCKSFNSGEIKVVK